MYVCVCENAHKCRSQNNPEDGTRPQVAGIAVIWQSAGMGSENQTQVPCNDSSCA